MPIYAVTDGQSQTFTLRPATTNAQGDTVNASGTCSVDITVAGPTVPETAVLDLAPNARVTAAFHVSGHADFVVQGDATTSLILNGANDIGPIGLVDAEIATDVAGTGTIDVGQWNQLDLTRGVGSGVTVNLNGQDHGTAYLTLEQPGGFKGSVNFTDGFVHLGNLAQATDYDLVGGVLTVYGGPGDAALAAVRFTDNSPEQAGLAVRLVNGSVTVAEAGTNAAPPDAAGTALTRHVTQPPAIQPPVVISDGATGQPVTTIPAQAYAGPVPGLQQQVISLTAESLNILATQPNLFIHTGSGTDAIQASSGTNVLDGGTGSNFLTAGSGTDTFFVDARGAAADTWSTVAKFHSGDAATLWGVSAATPQQWADGQGAAGATGLTLHAGAAGGPTASITLAGFSSADRASGKVTTSFGHDAASGSDYLFVHVT